MCGAPGEIRTPDPLVRSQVLYPAELRAHNLKDLINKKNALSLLYVHSTLNLLRLIWSYYN